MRRFHTLLKLASLWPQQPQSLSVPRTEMPKTRPATTTDAGDKACQNFTSSAELSHMEYHFDLKTYHYQNETKDSCHNLGFSTGILSMRTSEKSVKKEFSYVALLLNALQRKGGIYMISDCFLDFVCTKSSSTGHVYRLDRCTRPN